MDIVFKATFLIMIAVALLSVCGKSDTPKPATTATNNISLVAGDWVTTQWGGVTNDILVFTVSSTSYNAKVANLYGSSHGFATGDVIYSNIKANSDGTYSCNASYSANGSGTLSTRAATMSLQNNNTQLTVYYPEINDSFPAITYIFQQTSTTTIAL
jgi:flagellar basal body L-ring protein FlgH